jgi:hypothetical protein
MTLSIIGCVVNGPGEARETDIGFTGGGNNTHQVYIERQPDHRLKDQNIVDHLVESGREEGGRDRGVRIEQLVVAQFVGGDLLANAFRTGSSAASAQRV